MIHTALTIVEFCDTMRAFMGEEKIARYESYHSTSSQRFESVLADVQRYARYNEEVPAPYGNTAYGILWAVNSCRVNGSTHNGLKALHVDMLLMYAYAVHEHCNTMNEIPAYLMSLGL